MIKRKKQSKTKYSHALKISQPVYKRTGRFYTAFTERVSFKKSSSFIQKHPFTSFFITLLVLFGLIFLGSTVFKTQPMEPVKQSEIKSVETFKIGSSPKVSTQAQVEKSGVIKVTAQMPGIVSSVNFIEGEIVEKGTVLINLASNYQGGNVMSLSRQIARAQLDLSNQTFDTQKELIHKQRTVTERTDANADELRDIANRSLDESRSLLDLNESLLSTLNQDLSQATESAAIFQINQQRSQFQAVINQLRQGIRSAEFQSASDKPPAQLSDLQREIALKNLEIQDKSLEANKQITALQYQVAIVNEAQMYPAAPFAATIERVHVRVGQSVTPGTVLMTLTQTTDDIILNAKVPESIAKNLSRYEQSTVNVSGKTLELMPYYVSQEATEGQLYSVLYVLEDAYKQLFTDGSYVRIDIPVGTPDSNSIVPFIPLDAVFQTQDESVVYLNKNGKAQSKTVNLGDVQGRFVSVIDGIGSDDEIIVTRNVVEGDQVRVEQ